LSETEL